MQIWVCCWLLNKKIVPTKSGLMKFEGDARHLSSHGWDGSNYKITWHNGNVMGVVMIVSTFAHNLKYHNKSLFLFYISMIWASTFYYKLAT
jgi:hypothetical protein